MLRSKTGKGYHAYIFFHSAVPAWKARLVMDALLKEAQVIGEDIYGSSFDRLFPLQDELSKDRPLGNLIALPFQGKAANLGHTLFLDPESDYERPFQNQIDILENIRKSKETDLDRIISDWQLKKKEHLQIKTNNTSPERAGDSIPQGARNQTLISIAGSMRRRGLNDKEI